VRKLTFVLALTLGGPVPSWPQSAADLRAKYPAVAAYEVRPGILMTPLFAADGQVCEMLVEQHVSNTKAKTTINFDSPLSKETLRNLVDELAPPSQRGKQLQGIDNWFGSVTIDGPFLVTRYEFEKVTIAVNEIDRGSTSGGHTIVIIRLRTRVCVDRQGPSAAMSGERSTVSARK